MEENTGAQGLQALYTKIDPVKVIRSLVDKRSADNDTAISLHDNLIRLRNWEREIFENDLTEFESSNRSLTQEIRGHMKKIGDILPVIETEISNCNDDTVV
jgi:phage-related minor tail protein